MSGSKPGPLAQAWKGGIWHHSDGYIGIFNREHPRSSVRGYVFEHILVAEKALDRYLRPGEVVHHVNHDRADNRGENLLVCREGYHVLIHARERALLACGNPSWRPCGLCGSYDDPDKMHHSPRSSSWRHKRCAADREAERRRRFTPEQKAREAKYKAEWRRKTSRAPLDHPTMPKALVRQHRDEEFIKALAAAVDRFHEMMLDMKDKLKRRYDLFADEEFPALSLVKA